MRDEPAADRLPPWLRGPSEIVADAEEHLARGTPADRRLALIALDNAIEVCVDLFARLPRARRSAVRVPDERVEQAKSQSFHEKLEFLEWIAERKGVDLAIPIEDMTWHHDLRNELYHTGTGLIPPEEALVGARDAAGSVFELLFDRPLPSATSGPILSRTASEPELLDSGDESTDALGAALALVREIDPEASGVAPQLVAEGLERRGVELGSSEDVEGLFRANPDAFERRDEGTYAWKEEEGEIPISSDDGDGKRTGLVGKNLGLALYPIVRRLDPDRRGMSLRQMVDAAVSDGIEIGGGDPIQVVRASLWLARGRFTRIGRGVSTWLPLSVTESSATEVRAAAADLLQSSDRLTAGMDLSEIASSLESKGLVLRPPAIEALARALSNPSSSVRFRPIGRSRYALEDGTNRGSAEPVHDVRDVLPGDGQRLHDALLHAGLGISHAVCGPQVAYYIKEFDLGYIDASQNKVMTINRGWGDLPHAAGAVVYPRRFGEDDATVVRPESRRDWAASLRLMTGAAIGRREARAGALDRLVTDLLVRFDLDVTPPFRPGYGWGGTRVTEPRAGWREFWSQVVDAGLRTVPGFEGRRPTKQSSMGTSGRDGTYWSVRADSFGTLAIIFVSEDRAGLDWILQTVRSKNQIETAYGEPLVWAVDRGLSIIARCGEADVSVPGEEREAAVSLANGMIRLYRALEPRLSRLGPAS